MGDRAWRAVLVALVALVYLRGLAGIPLDWDDPIWLFDPIRAMPAPEAAWTAATTARDNVWAPVLRVSFAGALWVGGGSTAVVHAVSLALFLGSVAGVHTLLLRLGAAPPVATLAVGLWALHPSKVESVAWLTGLKDTESLALWVAAALTLVPPPGSPAPSPARIGLGTGLGVLALLTKAATFPLALVLGAVVAGTRAQAHPGEDSVAVGVREAVQRFGALTVCAFGVAAVGAAVWSMPPGHPPPPWSLPVRAAWVHGVFWSKALLLSAPTVITAVPASPWATIGVGAVAVAALAVAARSWPARTGVVALVWALPLVPFVGVAPMAFWGSDRHLLVPTLGLALGVAWVAEGLADAVGRGRVAVRAVGGVAVVGLAWLSFGRAADWHDSRRLWEVDVRRPGEHFARWLKVGVARGASGEFRGAEDAFDRSLALWPSEDAIAHRLVASLAVDGWGDGDAALAKLVEPPPPDAEGWARALDGFRRSGRPDLAAWADAQLIRVRGR